MKFRVFPILFATLFLFSATVFAQIPGTSQYPGSLDNRDTLIQTANSASTSLSIALGAADTSATVSSTSLFPITGTFTIDTEIFFYTGKTTTTFTGLLRGQDGSVAAAHSSGSSVQLRIISRTHMVQSDAIVNIQTKLGSGSSVPIAGTFLMGTGTGITAWQNPSVVQSGGSLTLASGGINQNIILMPSGTGNVGIGTTGPTSKLHVSDTSTTVFTKATATSGVSANAVENDTSGHSVYVTAQGTAVGGTQFGVNLADSGQIYTNSMPLAIGPFGNFNLTLGTNNAARMTILGGSGNVGIGTTVIASGQKLEINGGLNLTTVIAQPACSATTRGTFWVVQSAAGVKDKAEVCAKDQADVYAWRVIY